MLDGTPNPKWPRGAPGATPCPPCLATFTLLTTVSSPELTGKSTTRSLPSSSRTRQVMLLLAVPAAWMWAEPPPVTTAGAWTTCCWWGRSKGFPVTPPAPPLLSRSTLSLIAKRRVNVRRRNPIIFLWSTRRAAACRVREKCSTLVIPAALSVRPPRGEEWVAPQVRRLLRSALLRRQRGTPAAC